MKSIHTVMILHSYYPIIGGAERQLQALLPLLKERGVRATVLTRRYPGLSTFELIQGTPVFRLPAIGPKPIAAFTFIISAFFQLLKLRPDVIHSYDLMSPTSAALLVQKFHKVPVIAKVLSGGPKGDIDRIHHRPNGMARLRSITRQVDKFIVISQEIALELDAVGASQDKYVFIPNGVDPEKYIPATPLQKSELRKTLNLPANALIALYVGRIIPEKRPEHLLAIWNNIRRKFPQSILIMVGDGSELDRLRSLQVNGVYFTGQVESAEAYMQAADIFVLPSAREGLSNALLEAQAAGLPVVATAIGAAPELIKDGKSGLLVPVDDVISLEKAVLRLFGDVDLRTVLASAGRELVIAKYSLQSTANQLENLYRNLVETGKK